MVPMRSIPLAPVDVDAAGCAGESSVPPRWFQNEPSEWRRFRSHGRDFIYTARGSQIYQIDGTAFDAGADAIDSPASLFETLGLPLPASPGEANGPGVQSLSLAIAQSCNLSCTYCYAHGGDFGGPRTLMTRAVAEAAIDRLLADSRAGSRVHVTFLGGEPLLNRRLLRSTTLYARHAAARRGVAIDFSVTTNGSLLTMEDGEFFEEHGFAVTVSLDGIGELHDRQRPYPGNRGSYAAIERRVLPLLKMQRRMQLSARVTVTPKNLDLRRTLDGLLDMGFHSAGFSPMLASPAGVGQMSAADLEVMLEQMIECGSEFERRVLRHQRYAFSNMALAMQELHRGACRPYPCGAGLSYFGVSASGELSACHRFVNDPLGRMGHVTSGIETESHRQWRADRHVDRQRPCSDCWARYLCGGGCHHEVLHRGRPACDYIRGWLAYTLEAYARLLEHRPEYFDAAR